jgi:hypothetical protein
VAYVVARPNGRFEIRESVHTPKGPRARSLANFVQLTDEVLEAAEGRASRPFDPVGVIASADRAGVSVMRAARQASVRDYSPAPRQDDRTPEEGAAAAGEALWDLLALADQVAPFGAPRPTEPLRFPPLAHLAANRPTAP